MFASVLQRRRWSGLRLSRGAAVSVLAHIGAFALVAWLSTRPSHGKEAAPEVMFFSPTGTGAPGRPALGRPPPTTPQKTVSRTQRKPDTLYHSKDPYDEPPAKPADDGEPSGPYGDPNGDPNGTPGAGSPTGTVAAPPPPPPPPPPPTAQNAVIPFGPGMERPHKTSGPEPAYTREAREARVEGKMLVQCVITVDGRLEACQVLKSLPFMDQAVLAALAQQRWTPVTFQGQPVSVVYTIPFKFVLQ